MKRYFIIIALIILAGGLMTGAYFIYKKYKPVKTSTQSPTSQPTATSPEPSTNQPATTNTEPSANALSEPVKDFKARVTKKPFGIYITPQTSPVQPERFMGYHTGADAEYQDVTSDVPVYAISDGKVVISETASGYGGVFVVQVSINNALHNVLYGHIRPSSLPKVNTTFKKGDQLGLLGTGYSAETDGERRHLHFSVLTDTRTDIRGYVSTQSALSGWIDPLSLY